MLLAFHVQSYICTAVSLLLHCNYTESLAPAPDGLQITLIPVCRFRQAAGAGLLAGGLGQLLASPADLVKVQMQMEGRRRLQGHKPG